MRIVEFGDTLVEIFRNARKEQLKNRMQYGELYHTNYYKAVSYTHLREERGWTQAYVAELVSKTDRTIMNIENKGQHPSFNFHNRAVCLAD